MELCKIEKKFGGFELKKDEGKLDPQTDILVAGPIIFEREHRTNIEKQICYWNWQEKNLL